MEHNDECPNCHSGTLERSNNEFRCRGECGTVWVNEDIPTYRLATCLHCGEAIAEVKDPCSGVLDWYANGGDFGCGQSPDTDDEGCGSHKPSGG